MDTDWNMTAVMRYLLRIKQQGQGSKDRSSKDRTARTGQQGHGARTGRKDRAEGQGSKDRAARTR